MFFMAIFFYIMTLFSLIPSLVIYAFFAWALFNLFRNKNFQSILIFTISVVPFVAYAFNVYEAAQEIEKDKIEYQSFERKSVVIKPKILVLESESVYKLRPLFEITGVDQIILKGAYGDRMMAIDNQPDRFGGYKMSEVLNTPDEFALLRIGRASKFAKPGQIYHADGGPFELRLFKDGSDHLIDVWSQPFRKIPSFPPVLTFSGWIFIGNSGIYAEIGNSLANFLTKNISK
jgi:hypothetical protein